MKKLISAVLFRLGLIISAIGAAMLAYYNFGCSTILEEKFDRSVTVAFSGLIIMLVSFAIDLIPQRKDDKNDR